MYNVINKDSIYIAGYFGLCREYHIYEIGDERALIRYLAKSYVDREYYNPAYDAAEYFNGYGKHINPRNYEKEAWNFYTEHIKNKTKSNKSNYVKNKIYYGVFRETPVPHTRKRIRGSRCIKSRKLKHIAAMYANPEYKDFNRGSRNDYPEGWFDDWHRCVQRSWKSQSKRKHQWKERGE